MGRVEGEYDQSISVMFTTLLVVFLNRKKGLTRGSLSAVKFDKIASIAKFFSSGVASMVTKASEVVSASFG